VTRRVLHLCRDDRTPPTGAVAGDDRVVYTAPAGDASGWRLTDETVDPDRLLELVFAADLVVVW